MGQNKFVKRSSNAHKDDEHMGDIFETVSGGVDVVVVAVAVVEISRFRTNVRQSLDSILCPELLLQIRPCQALDDTSLAASQIVIGTVCCLW